MDLSTFAGADYKDVELAGTLYRVGVLTLDEWAVVQAWIKANVPGPLSLLKSAELAGLDDAGRRELYKLALEEARAWPPRLVSRAWFAALDAPGGHAILLRAILGKHRPTITLAECERLAEELSNPVVIPLVAFAFGVPDDPKPPAPRATATPPRGRTTSATSPTRSRRRGAGRSATSSA